MRFSPPRSRRAVPLTTVGIPLFRSARWLPTLMQNVEELSPVARILISDDTEHDLSLAALQKRFGGHPNVEFVGQRTLSPGWAPHCNDLKFRAKTPYFMWLPHDDTVHADWILSGQEALRTNPEAVLAVGSLRRVTEAEAEAEAEGQILHPSPENEIHDPVDRVTSALRRQFVTREPGFGHAFHGVQRQKSTPFLPELTPSSVKQQDGWKADVFWAVETLTMGTFATTRAEYGKILYPASTSAKWELENTVAGFRQALSQHLWRLSPADRLDIISTLWDEEATGQRLANKGLRRKVLLLRDKLQ